MILEMREAAVAAKEAQSGVSAPMEEVPSTALNGHAEQAGSADEALDLTAAAEPVAAPLHQEEPPGVADEKAGPMPVDLSLDPDVALPEANGHAGKS